jgi:hypothetical protein
VKKRTCTLENLGDWQWEKVDQSYFPSKIPLFEISCPVQSVRRSEVHWRLSSYVNHDHVFSTGKMLAMMKFLRFFSVQMHMWIEYLQ